MKDPVPAESKKAGSVEDTLLLLDMLKNMKQKDKEAEKVGIHFLIINKCCSSTYFQAKLIHNMAMAQKKKMDARNKS